MAEEEQDVFVDRVKEEAVLEVDDGGVAEQKVVAVLDEVFQAGLED